MGPAIMDRRTRGHAFHERRKKERTISAAAGGCHARRDGNRKHLSGWLPEATCFRGQDAVAVLSSAGPPFGFRRKYFGAAGIVRARISEYTPRVGSSSDDPLIVTEARRSVSSTDGNMMDNLCFGANLQPMGTECARSGDFGADGSRRVSKHQHAAVYSVFLQSVEQAALAVAIARAASSGAVRWSRATWVLRLQGGSAK